MKKMGNVLISLGILLLAYVMYEQVSAMILEKKIIASTEEISRSLKDHVKGESKEGVVSNSATPHPITYPLQLTIPAINLQTKVLKGTSKDILRVAVGHLEGSGRLGVLNENFVLLGHRSHVTGKFFNRLNELEVGDSIILSNETSYTYNVIEKKIIQPTQLEVIEPIEGKTIVTLITCHPKYSSKQRLVVVAEKVK